MLCVGCNLACFIKKKRIKRRWGGKGRKKKGRRKIKERRRKSLEKSLETMPWPCWVIPSLRGALGWLSWPCSPASQALRGFHRGCYQVCHPCEHESFPPRLVGSGSFAQGSAEPPGRGAEGLLQWHGTHGTSSPMLSPLALILLKTKKHPT